MGATTLWAERMQPYVDAWATAPEHVVTEARPHDDAAWVAYITWYVQRTQTRVMYVPMVTPTDPGRAQDPSSCHVPGATGSELRSRGEFGQSNRNL